MVELLVNKYKYGNDNAENVLPCLRRRTRHSLRDSFQCTNTCNASPPAASSATDNTKHCALPYGDTYAQPHVQIGQEKKPELRCYC